MPTGLIDILGSSIHIWPVRLQASREAVAGYLRQLNGDERDRAGRFVFPHLQDSFILSRGALRMLLGAYTGVQPSAIRLEFGPNGKPSLAGDSPIRFNLSHAGDFAVYAFAENCEMGVDIELIRSLDDMEAISRHYFSPQEAAELASVPVSGRTRAFFSCWTRKEAYIKATGEGLSAQLNSFRVAFTASEEPQILQIAGDSASAWNLHDLPILSGYAGALVYRGLRRIPEVMGVKDAAELLSLRGAREQNAGTLPLP